MKTPESDERITSLTKKVNPQPTKITPDSEKQGKKRTTTVAKETPRTMIRAYTDTGMLCFVLGLWVCFPPLLILVSLSSLSANAPFW